MEILNVNFYAPLIDEASLELAEIKIYKMLDPVALKDFILVRQELASKYNIIISTANWDNCLKTYTLLYKGKTVSKFLQKIKQTEVFSTLIQQLQKNKIDFIDFKITTDEDYQETIPTYTFPLLDASEYNKKEGFKINSKGYRCPEFENIDWKNSIVLIGCSMACSVGLEEHDTLHTQLFKLTGMPVVSLGVAGSSPQFSFDNSILLKENFPEPKYVIQLWSEYNRSVLYKKDKILHQGSTWNEERLKYFSSEHLAITMHTYHNASKHIWQNYLAYSFFNTTASLLNIPELPYVDFATDNSHYGPVSSKLCAERIARDILPSLVFC